MAGRALGLALKDEIAPAVLLGSDLAFRVVLQVLLDRSYTDAAHLVDLEMHSFIRGYYDGKRKV